MLNSKAFKKLAALTAAIALVGSFAVSASAEVTTKTTYVGEDIKVAVSVTGYENGTHVTYYAEKAGTPYHVDQATVTDGVAEFDSFVTDAENLNAKVLVNGTEDEITGNTITVVDGTSDIKVLPTEEKTATVLVTFTPGANMKVTGATATGATVDSCEPSNGQYTVELINITGDVVITMTQEEEEVDNSTGKYITAGYVNTDEGVKITVLGQVSGLASGAEYGAKINGTPFKSLFDSEPTNGYFAIQVIGSDFAAGSYSTGIYYKNAAGTVVDKDGDTLTVELQ